MTTRRPITDVWILARPKVPYYGAYPSGFLSRARVLIGARIQDPVLHVCSGKILEYPFRGFGRHDKTLDVDASLSPDFVQDARLTWPLRPGGTGWRGILADPPYTEDDADHYKSGRLKLPTPTELLVQAHEVLIPGGRIGILHYIWPKPPKGLTSIAVVAVLMGFHNRARLFSVYEKDGE